jgi:hypothetical protein
VCFEIVPRLAHDYRDSPGRASDAAQISTFITELADYEVPATK